MTELKFALSIEEAADYTGIGRNTLRNLVEWEKLPILRVGRKILIRRERLDEFLILNEGKDLRDRHAVKAMIYLHANRLYHGQVLRYNQNFWKMRTRWM